MDKYKEEEHSQSRLQNNIFFLPVLNKGRSIFRGRKLFSASQLTLGDLFLRRSLCVKEEKDHQISKLQSFVQLVDIEFDHHTSNFCLTH